jgi:hypothetical protein
MRFQVPAGDKDVTNRKTRMIVGGEKRFYITPPSVAKE